MSITINRVLDAREIAIGEERAVQYLQKMIRDHQIGNVAHYRIFSQKIQDIIYKEELGCTIYKGDVGAVEHFMVLEMYKERLESYKNKKPEIIFTTKVNIKDFLKEEDYTDYNENENSNYVLEFKKHESHIRSIYYAMLHNDDFPEEYSKLAFTKSQDAFFNKEVDLMIYDVALESFKENFTTEKLSSLLIERLKHFTYRYDKIEILFRKDLKDPWEHVLVYKDGSVVLDLEADKLDCELVLSELAYKTNLFEYTYDEIENEENEEN